MTKYTFTQLLIKISSIYYILGILHVICSDKYISIDLKMRFFSLKAFHLPT